MKSRFKLRLPYWRKRRGLVEPIRKYGELVQLDNPGTVQKRGKRMKEKQVVKRVQPRVIEMLYMLCKYRVLSNPAANALLSNFCLFNAECLMH